MYIHPRVDIFLNVDGNNIYIAYYVVLGWPRFQTILNISKRNATDDFVSLKL